MKLLLPTYDIPSVYVLFQIKSISADAMTGRYFPIAGSLEIRVGKYLVSNHGLIGIALKRLEADDGLLARSSGYNRNLQFIKQLRDSL